MHAAPDAPSEITDRLRRAQRAAAERGLDALVIGTGADLRYLTGYDAHLSERITALVLPAAADPVFVVPRLESSLAGDSAAGRLGVAIEAWDETDDPYALIASIAGGSAIAMSDRMWAQHVFGLRDAAPQAQLQSAAPTMAALRMVKSPAEIEALRRAAAAIDTVHAQVPALLVTGRSESEVAADLSRLIVEAGHVSAAFTIVGSGPNGASPHHEFSDRALTDGDLVVVDIGGPMPDGYESDSTRTYVLGDPSDEYAEMYAVLQAAHQAAVEAARPGITCAAVDAAARDVITNAGMGERFIHRTGHGIGLDGHEHPYLVAGNEQVLAAGMTFSIEPGIYLEGQYGARLEDICAVTDGPLELLNSSPRELVRVGD
ncbi:M24 family metallopeptidase [Epidermidibacterium keratini]|uniref:M24 family metallopeptidase n=1 Tax=Epidermidibacterium keratini TaxID=1891644 RepID=A0A7L4YS92_9ACTN|nr:Xaa-Pro peptidase family protein [Epidermidibacterium keratini]QHC02046.1 M24 family metallopeptidase [Epidermidibacterium keratini]